MVRHIENATGRANAPTASSTEPPTCVAAALRVQNDGSPGRKPKNFDTTLAESPSTLSILSIPWWIMRAHVPMRSAVTHKSVTGLKTLDSKDVESEEESPVA